MKKSLISIMLISIAIGTSSYPYINCQTIDNNNTYYIEGTATTDDGVMSDIDTSLRQSYYTQYHMDKYTEQDAIDYLYNGKNIELDNKEDAIGFINYALSLDIMSQNIPYIRYSHAGDSKYTVISSGEIVDYKTIVNEIISTYGSGIKGSTDYEKAYREMIYLYQTVDYDIDIADTADTPYILATNRGVCRNIATIYNVVANNAGIPTRIVYGGIHEWCQSYINGQWINVDPTWGEIDNIGDNDFVTSETTFRTDRHEPTKMRIESF